MSTPSIKVGQGNWGIKALNLLGYANTDKKFVARDFTVGRLLNTATRVNASGNIEGVNANVPRIDYFGGQASLLVEPSAVNGIRNNSMVGAVAGSLPGSSGALPTNWGESLNGLVRQSVALGTENGVSYIDIRYSGTATGGSCAVLFETATQIVASTSQNWSNSVYLKIIAQPNPPIAYRLSMWEYNTGGTVFGGSFATAVVPTTTSLQRFTQTRALTGATTDRVRPLFDVSMTSGQYYDFTIRIGYPQMEQSSVATSVIPTTTGSVTRNADVISVTGVAGLIGQTEGTIYAEVDVRTFTSSAARRIISLRVDGSNVLSLEINAASTNIEFVATSGGVSVTAVASGLTAGISKIAVGYNSAASGTVLYVNGVLRDTKTIAIPTLSAAVFGLGVRGDGGAGTQLNDRIRAVSIYQTRLPNTTTDGSPSLQSITTL